MKLAVSTLAAVLLSTLACSKTPAQEPAALAPAPAAARAIAPSEVARAPDTAPAADPGPSPEEVAAFHAPVPK